MDEYATPADIARLEEHIEGLRDAIARCRKIALTAKLLIAGGALWLVLTLLWVIPFITAIVVAAIAAALGGIVLAGSNSTTWQQTETRLANSEAMRAEMIGQLEMRVVGRNSRMVH